MAVQVSKEFGISYFDLIEKNVIEVLVCASYLQAKASQIERKYKNNGKTEQ